jgi:hypothetical protein
MDSKQLAMTIRNQIGANTLMCIGAHALTIVPENDDHRGGLTFKINPNPKMKLHGKVTVLLAFNDTYKVKVETCRGKVMLDASEVSCDMLGGPNGVIEGVTG